MMGEGSHFSFFVVVAVPHETYIVFTIDRYVFITSMVFFLFCSYQLLSQVSISTETVSFIGC